MTKKLIPDFKQFDLEYIEDDLFSGDFELTTNAELDIYRTFPEVKIDDAKKSEDSNENEASSEVKPSPPEPIEFENDLLSDDSPIIGRFKFDLHRNFSEAKTDNEKKNEDSDENGAYSFDLQQSPPESDISKSEPYNSEESNDSDDGKESKREEKSEAKLNQPQPEKIAQQLFSSLEIKVNSQEKFITINGIEYQYRSKSKDKGEGVTEGWMLYSKEANLNSSKPIGMIKLPKAQLLNSRAENDYSVIGEALAMGIADILGFHKKSNSQMVMINSGKGPQIALFSLFDTVIPLDSFIAGNNPNRNNGLLKPLKEGYKAPSFDHIEDLSHYLIYLFLLNDNDAIGKTGNNAALVFDSKDPENPKQLRMFTYDKLFCLNLNKNSQMFIDERFNVSTPYYQDRMNRPLLYSDILGRHGAMRNFSVVMDGQLSVKFQAFLTAKSNISNIHLFIKAAKNRLEKYPAYVKKLSEVEEELNKRWRQIEDSLKSTLELYENLDCNLNLLDTIQGMEQCLSQTSMYSEEGTPFRTPHLLDEKEKIIISIEKKDDGRIILIKNAPKDWMKKLPEKLENFIKRNQNFSKEKVSNWFYVPKSKWKEFENILAKELNPLQVLKIKHPEVLSFNDFKEKKSEADQFMPNQFLISPDKLIKMNPESRNIVFYESYQTLYQAYLKPIDHRYFKLNILNTMLIHVNDLLSTVQNSPKEKMVLKHLAASIVKEQQLFLIILLLKQDVIMKKLQFSDAHFIRSESWHSFFDKAHQLDLNESINKLLITFLTKKDPASDTSQKVMDFLKKFNNQDISAKNYLELKELSNNFSAEITSLVSSLNKVSPQKGGLFHSKPASQSVAYSHYSPSW